MACIALGVELDSNEDWSALVQSHSSCPSLAQPAPRSAAPAPLFGRLSAPPLLYRPFLPRPSLTRRYSCVVVTNARVAAAAD